MLDPTPPTIGGPDAPAAALPTGLAFELRRTAAGPLLATGPVLPGDLRELRSEAWWQAGPRRGDFDCDEAALPVRVQAIRRPAGDAPGGPMASSSPLTPCVGLSLAAGPGLVTASSTVLVAVARRAAAELVRDGILAADESFVYDFRGDATVIGQARRLDLAVRDGAVLGRTRDLRHEVISLAGLLANSVASGDASVASGDASVASGDASVASGDASTASGETSPDDHHLFITDTAWQRAEAIARRGERQQPSVETGGVLLGFLGSCPDAADAFVVVTDAIEARDADQREFSLSFSGKSWQRIDNVVRARAARPGAAALRVLGQMHGHPFQPTTGCAACPLNAECEQHSAHLSADDRRWSRAVFSGQPWQLGIVFGIDPRSRPVATTYGMRGGQLTPRGFRRIAEADLERLRAPRQPPPNTEENPHD